MPKTPLFAKHSVGACQDSRRAQHFRESPTEAVDPTACERLIIVFTSNVCGEQQEEGDLLDLALCPLAVVGEQKIPERKVAGGKDACHLQNGVDLCDKQ